MSAGLPFTKTSQVCVNTPLYWDLRSQTRKGNREFVRIFVGETSEGMGQILGKRCLRLAAIRAGVRELSG